MLLKLLGGALNSMLFLIELKMKRASVKFFIVKALLNKLVGGWFCCIPLYSLALLAKKIGLSKANICKIAH